MDKLYGKHDNPLYKYYKDTQGYKVLDKEEERELLIKAKNGDIEARNKIVLHHARFVAKKIRKYTGHNVDALDLNMIGIEGLYEAIDRFDLSYDTRFSSYAGYWIIKKISDAIAAEYRCTNIPKSIYNHYIEKVNKERELTFDLKRKPSRKELKRQLDFKEHIFNEAETLDIENLYMDDNKYEEIYDEVVEGDTYDYPKENEIICKIATESAEKTANVLLMNADITKLLDLAHLTEHERVAVLEYNGFNDGVHTFQEIGDMLGMSKQAVQQNYKNALTKLRRAALGLELDDYMDDPFNARREAFKLIKFAKYK